MKEEEEIIDQLKNVTLEEQKQQNNLIQPYKVFIDIKQVHKGPITGISRHDTNQDLFSTISEDNTMRLWDYRIGSSVRLFQLKSKEQVANCLIDKNFIWGACDNKILQFDLRKEQIIYLSSDNSSQYMDSEINQISIDKEKRSICASYDSGDNYIFDKDTLEIQCVLKGLHSNACFSNDFIYDSNGQQLCFTSGFDYKITGWNYSGVQNGLVVKQTDLQKLHTVYSPESVSPPIIYSINSSTNQMLISVETGHIYGFSVDELTRTKNIKKKPPKPDFCLDGHIGKVMRSIYCHFDASKFVSISTDHTMGIWNVSQFPQLIQKIKLQKKPNWIETFRNNLLLVGDISDKLSIFILQ